MSSDGSDLRQRLTDALDDLDYGHDGQERRYVFVDDALEAVMAVRDERLETVRDAYGIVRGQLKATRKEYSELMGEMLVWRERAEKAEAALARVRSLHPSYEEARAAENALCLECAQVAPCRTRRDIDALAAVRGEELEQLRLIASVNAGLYRSAHEEAELAEAAIARVRAIADRLGREEHPTHDHLCPDDLRRELLAALDSLPEAGTES